MILPKIATRTEQERRVASLLLRKQSFKNSLLRNHLSLIICTFFCSDSALPPPSFPPSLRVRSPSHCLKTLETQPQGASAASIQSFARKPGLQEGKTMDLKVSLFFFFDAIFPPLDIFFSNCGFNVSEFYSKYPNHNEVSLQGPPPPKNKKNKLPRRCLSLAWLYCGFPFLDENSCTDF